MIGICHYRLIGRLLHDRQIGGAGIGHKGLNPDFRYEFRPLYL